MFYRNAFSFLLLSISVVLVSSLPPEGPSRSLFRPKERFPVHFKSGPNNNAAIKKKIEEKLSTNLRFSSALPLITEVTPPNDAKVKPTVRIFTIDSPSSGAAVASKATTTKSLLDETEPLSVDDIATSSDLMNETETENDDSVATTDKNELDGQATLYGGILGVVGPTPSALPVTYTRSPYVGRGVRPRVVSPMLLPSPGSTVVVPLVPRPPVGPPTQVPILGVGPSPSISTVQMPSPPPMGSTGVRSLFSSGRSNMGRSRQPTRESTSNANFSPSETEKDSDVITDFLFSDIKCYRTKQKEYFGAKIHLKSGFHTPYIRDRPDDPMTSSECQLEPTRDSSTYHMKMTDLRGCGVEQCGESMCITMVFPRMPTLSLADDEVTTIKCLPQRSSMAETKSISFAGDSIDKRRSGSTVEGGGQEFAAEVGVFRQSPGSANGLFVKRVNSGGTVQLGEPLQLRSVVRGGDGWTFSKLSDVKVWRMRESFAAFTPTGKTLNPSDASEVITLVDERGCRNEKFGVIADSSPIRDPRNDLVHHFTFKAFLFRGQRSTEPLIVTAKVQACQERDDCDFTDCSVTRDQDDSRYKRSLPQVSSNSTQMNWDAQMALHVIGLNEEISGIQTISPESDVRVYALGACADKMGISAFIAAFVTLLLTLLTFNLVNFWRNGKHRAHKFEKTVEKMRHQQIQRVVSHGTGKSSDYVRYSTAAAQNDTPPPSRKILTNQNHASVANLLQQLADDAPSQNPTKTDDNDGGVYVVYYKRSRSAPGSFREKMAPNRSVTTDLEDNSEDDLSPNFERPRQTVRSVKKRSKRRRCRKEIPTVYRHPVTTPLTHHGSTTSIRIIGTDSEPKHTSSQDSNYPATHFVTRNESSTQIVIIPETNV